MDDVALATRRSDLGSNLIDVGPSDRIRDRRNAAACRHNLGSNLAETTRSSHDQCALARELIAAHRCAYFVHAQLLYGSKPHKGVQCACNAAAAHIEFNSPKAAVDAGHMPGHHRRTVAVDEVDRNARENRMQSRAFHTDEPRGGEES